MLNKCALYGDRVYRQYVSGSLRFVRDVLLELRNANRPGQKVGVMKRKVPKKSGHCARLQHFSTLWNKSVGIVIPFFSLLIKDIYFLNEGCANRLQNGHINFEKFWEFAKQVSEFMTWKKVECPFEKDRKILQYLLTAPAFTEDALYLASYESEGPENNMEKDRWKSLRSTLLSRV